MFRGAICLFMVKQMFIETADIFTIGLLIFLEGVLSIDNALALALIARGLPKHQQKKALTYGLLGAIVFRVLALAMAGFIIKFVWIRYVGGAYLIFLALNHWIRGNPVHTEQTSKAKTMSFWKAVLLIELTDIAFAADSILAAVALSPKLWVIIFGAVIGLIIMRFAAHWFIQLLEKFPNFEFAAYLLVMLVGIKLILDGLKIPAINFHSSDSPAFWVFWILLALAVASGFLPRKKSEVKADISALKAEAKAVEKIEDNN